MSSKHDILCLYGTYKAGKEAVEKPQPTFDGDEHYHLTTLCVTAWMFVFVA